MTSPPSTSPRAPPQLSAHAQVYGGLVDNLGVLVFRRGQGTFNVIGLYDMQLDQDTPAVVRGCTCGGHCVRT